MFYLISIRLAKVEVLKETQLSDPLYEIRLKSSDRLRPVKSVEADSEEGESGQEIVTRKR